MSSTVAFRGWIMRIRSLGMLLIRLGFGKGILKQMAAGLLGVAILGWVAAHSGPSHGRVIVHVTEPDVEVSFGDRTIRIEDRRYDPIVSRLLPGRYDLVMKRHGRVLHEESFEIRRGSTLVLTAWDKNRDHQESESEAAQRPLTEVPTRPADGALRRAPLRGREMLDGPIWTASTSRHIAGDRSGSYERPLFAPARFDGPAVGHARRAAMGRPMSVRGMGRSPS
jgi:hypothetical protein